MLKPVGARSAMMQQEATEASERKEIIRILQPSLLMGRSSAISPRDCLPYSYNCGLEDVCSRRARAGYLITPAVPKIRQAGAGEVTRVTCH